MADELVFGAGFDPNSLGAMPITRVAYWFKRYIDRRERLRNK